VEYYAKNVCCCSPKGGQQPLVGSTYLCCSVRKFSGQTTYFHEKT
jgi:hypothetical protein